MGERLTSMFKKHKKAANERQLATKLTLVLGKKQSPESPDDYGLIIHLKVDEDHILIPKSYSF